MPSPPSRSADTRTAARGRGRPAVDPDVNAVYTAEDRLARWFELGTVTVFGSRWALEPEVLFARVEDVQHYADRVLAHLALQGWRVAGSHPDSTAAPLPPVLVRERRGDRKAHYEQGKHTIAMPAHGRAQTSDAGWALRESVVLHELAHHLCATGASAPSGTALRARAGSDTQGRPDDGLGHGPGFRRTLLRLFVEAGHPTASALLAMAFADEGLAS